MNSQGLRRQLHGQDGMTSSRSSGVRFCCARCRTA
jgi:hypothetical protein